MKKLSFLFLLLMFGCTDSEENASTNLRKGDEFFAKGEYEVAEYYYDKIPEESVLYKTVLRRKQEIEKMNADPSRQDKPNKTTESVTIVRHTYQTKLGRLPIHKITLANNTAKKLQLIDVEFVYLDAANKEVTRLTSNVFADIDPNGKKDLNEISPGIVSEPFTNVKVTIKRTLFY